MLIATITLAFPMVPPPHGGAYLPPPPAPMHDGVLPRPSLPTGPGGGAGSPGGKPLAPGPGPAAGSPSGGGGPEPSSWRHWWALSGDRWIDLKGHVHGLLTETASDDFYLGRGTESRVPAGDLCPTAAEIDGRIVPLLFAELSSDHTDRVTAAMIGLAKIGPRDIEPADFVAAFEGHLKSPIQEIGETAALALGLSGCLEAEGTLVDLALDRSRGRTLTGGSEVPLRTRAFAAYGLGLLGAGSEDLTVRHRITEVLMGIVDNDDTSTKELPVAAVSAIGLVPMGDAPFFPRLDSGRRPGDHAVHALSRRTQLAWLVERVAPEDPRKARKIHWLVRAHGARTLGRLGYAAPSAVRHELVEALVRTLRRREEPEHLHQSLVLSLGWLVDADSDAADELGREALIKALADGQPQVRRYAVIALARVGARTGTGEEPDAGQSEVRDLLMTTLSRGNSQLRPWAGLALGVLGRELSLRGQVPDGDVSRALRAALSSSAAPESVGAYALALGLRRDVEALPLLEQKLKRIDDPMAQADLALALGLVGERSHAHIVSNLLEGARYRPLLLHGLATASALMHDRELVPELVTILREARSTAVQSAVAAALGTTGDRRALEPLLALAEDKGATDSARAFACAALGGIADRHRLPWRVPYAEDANVRILMTTQSDGSSGLFDIL